MTRAFALVVLACACGRVDFDPLPPSQSGTRLRAVRWVTSDGVALFDHWFDRQLGMACRFYMAADGTYRCFPTDATVGTFADASCTVPAVFTPEGCAPPPYATDGARSSLYAVGAAIGTGYYMPAGTCVADPGPGAFYLRGEPAPLDVLVAASLVVTPVDDDLARGELVADDGARQDWEVFATATGDPCAFYGLDGSRAACAATASTSLFDGHRLYLEATCATEIDLYVPPGAVVTRHFNNEPCLPPHVYLTGTPHDVSVVYFHDAAGGCSLFPLGTTATVVEVADLALSAPVVGRIVDRAGARVHLESYVTPGGAGFAPTFYDDVFGAPCTPRATTATGDGVCVPFASGSGMISISTATDCSSPQQFFRSCGGPVDQAAGTFTCGGDVIPAELATLAEPATAPSHATVGVAGECAPADLTGTSLFQLDLQPLDPGTLAPLTLELE